MIAHERKALLLNRMADLIELPESAYQRAKDRYDDFGKWLGRADSKCKDYDPHIFPQGSFRLGTAIRPLVEDEAYDLDLSCKLRRDVTKSSHTQEELKKIVGHEIETHRVARGIKAPKKEKHRCWRLEYQDEMSFHMDIVPCIPEDESRRKLVFESLRKAGEVESLAGSVSELTVSITDDRHPNYKAICDNWNISNPEGYAQWFESRMDQGMQLLFEKAQVDKLPVYSRKTPLQRVIQLLKRHRDIMFKDDPEVKPISIIITTLAAKAYQAESDIELALRNTLPRMDSLVNPTRPRVPNPVDPKEDFADRWSMPKYKHLNLEQNFKNWLRQAQIDLDIIGSSEDASFITEQAVQKYAVRMDADDLKKHLGLAYASISVAPKVHTVNEPAKPWGTGV